MKPAGIYLAKLPVCNHQPGCSEYGLKEVGMYVINIQIFGFYGLGANSI
jgi:putative component of membrane protein insertase Oxa1/YidC/SpoIIIJ protein YidD